MVGTAGNMNVKTSYSGAYEERVNQRKTVTQGMPSAQENEKENETAQMKEDWKSDKVIFSQEAKDFLQGVSERKEAARQKEMEIQAQIDIGKSDNVFENTLSINSQSLSFSEILSKHGFFDGMSDEEVKQMEETLADITSGMDSLNREKDNNNMSSSVAMAELESSTGALRFFNQKYVPKEQQEEFGKLIDQYYSYNKKNVEGHMSLRERFDELKKNMPASNVSNPNQAQSAAIASDNASKALGNVTHTKDDKNKLNEAYEAVIAKMLKGDLSVDEAVENIHKLSNDYSSGSSKNSNVINMLELRNGNYFNNMKEYWSKLIG